MREWAGERQMPLRLPEQQAKRRTVLIASIDRELPPSFRSARTDHTTATARSEDRPSLGMPASGSHGYMPRRRMIATLPGLV